MYAIFDAQKFDGEVYFKLQVAECEACETNKRFSSEEVLKSMHDAIGERP